MMHEPDRPRHALTCINGQTSFKVETEDPMEVDSSIAVNCGDESWSGFPSGCAPTSPGAQSVSSSVSARSNGKLPKSRKKAQPYNRNNIQMYEYMDKDPDKIGAKVLRVLVPSMFQNHLHPDKELNKTKVKGLWDPNNKPTDWPAHIEFKDPNNTPKLTLAPMKDVFIYLRDKIRTVNPTRQVVESQQMTVGSLPYPTASSTVVPNLEAFHSYPHQSRSSTGAITPGRGTVHMQEEKPVLSGLPTQNVQRNLFPATLQDFQDDSDDDGALFNKVGVSRVGSQASEIKMEPEAEQAPQVLTINNYQEMAYIPEMQSPQVVFKGCSVDTDGCTVRDLTVLHRVPVQLEEEPSSYQTITIGEGSSVQPVDPAESAPQTNHLNPQITKCVTFAHKMQSEMYPVLTEFEQTFSDNVDIVEKVKLVLTDVFNPLLAAARVSSQNCLRLSKLCSVLEEILKRYTFLGAEASSLELLQELDSLASEYAILNIVPSHAVPAVASEVQVMRAEATVVPDFSWPGKDHYIPTIEQMNKRAERKEKELEGDDGKMPCEQESLEGSGEKVLVEKMHYGDPFSPVCNKFDTLNINTSLTDQEPFNTDPVADLGISLKPMSPETEKDYKDLLEQISALSGDHVVGDALINSIEQTRVDVQQTQAASVEIIQNNFGSVEATQAVGVELVQGGSGSAESMQTESNLMKPSAGFMSEGIQDVEMEDEAWQGLLADAAKWSGSSMGGSVLSDRPLQFQSDPVMPNDYENNLLNDILELQDLDSFQSSGFIQMLQADELSEPLPVEQAPAVTSTVDTSRLLLSQARTRLPLNLAPTPTTLPPLQSKMQTSIPLTVLEKAADLDQDSPPAKRRSVAKGKGPKRGAFGGGKQF